MMERCNLQTRLEWVARKHESTNRARATNIITCVQLLSPVDTPSCGRQLAPVPQDDTKGV